MFRSWFQFPALAWANVATDDSRSYFWAHERHHGHPGRGGPHGRHRRESFERGWEDEPRNRRGDIKYILLELLAEGSSHGYDLIKAMENRSSGFRRLSPGSVYPTLQMLEEGGYLTSESVSGKRVYTITDAGRALLAERQSSPESRNLRDLPPELSELRDAATELSAVVMQVARSGNAARMSRVRELLAQTQRAIHAMLAEAE